MGGGLARSNSAPLLQLDPEKYLPPGQTLTLSSMLYCLDFGMEPGHKKAWHKKKVWLTSGGGIFNGISNDGTLVGRDLGGVDAAPVEDVAKPFAFTLRPGEGNDPDIPTVYLAANDAEERSKWLAAIGEAALVSNTALDPMSIYKGAGIQGRRRRMSTCAPLEKHDFKSERSLAPSLCRASSVKSSYKSKKSSSPPMSDDDEEEINKLANVPKGYGIRRSSQAGFSEKSNTVLVLDWDDTLFPTTWICHDLGLDWRRPLLEQAQPSPDLDIVLDMLKKLGERVATLIKTAASIAHVVIVTLAADPWVSISSEHFMPQVSTLLGLMGIEVIYARDYITDAMKQEYNRSPFKTPEQESTYYMRAKCNAIQSVLTDVYDAVGASWKNVISFGDSEAERTALITAVNEYMDREATGGVVVRSGLTAEVVTKSMHHKKVRTKTIKMLGEPSCEELTAQLNILETWLPHIVESDDGLNEQIETVADEELNTLNKKIANSDKEVTWAELAGIQDIVRD